MSEYFSTQSTVEARISALRLNGFLDRDADGIPDSGALTAGFAFARGIIRGKLESRYGQDIIDLWDSDTVPELVQSVSDDLCIYQYFVSNPRFYEVGRAIKDAAYEVLDSVANGNISLYGVDAPVDDEVVVSRIPSDFDPERELDDMTARTTWILPDDRELEGY